MATYRAQETDFQGNRIGDPVEVDGHNEEDAAQAAVRYLSPLPDVGAVKTTDHGWRYVSAQGQLGVPFVIERV